VTVPTELSQLMHTTTTTTTNNNNINITTSSSTSGVRKTYCSAGAEDSHK